MKSQDRMPLKKNNHAQSKEDKKTKKELQNEKKRKTKLKRHQLIVKLKSGEWDFSQEKEFMENLFVGRFNYFLVVFSLFLTAGFANNFTNLKSIVFYIGFIFLLMCWVPLYRAFRKFDLIMRIVYEEGENKEHTTKILEDIRKAERSNLKIKIPDNRRPRITYWMGIYIPLISIISMFFIGLMISLGHLVQDTQISDTQPTTPCITNCYQNSTQEIHNH